MTLPDAAVPDPDRDAVLDPSTDASALAELAGRRSDLGVLIARHPHAYEALLSWLTEYGAPDAQQAASSRLQISRPVRDDSESPVVTAKALTRQDVPGAGESSARRGLSVKGKILVGSIALVILVIGGGAVAITALKSGGAFSTEGDTNSEAVPDDCDSYLALTVEERKEAYVGETHGVYGATGVADVPVTDAYDAECPAQSGQNHLLMNIDSDADSPSCSVFLELTPEQRQSWIPALLQEEYWQVPPARTNVDVLSAACVDFALPTNNMVRLSSYLGDMPSYAAWSTQTRLGYSWQTVLGVRAPLVGDAVQPLGGGSLADGTTAFEYTPGSACGYDPATDAVVPLNVLLTSTTSGSQAIPMAARWRLETVPGSHPLTTAYLEGGFSSGTSCSDAADMYGTAVIRMAYEQPHSEAYTHNFSVILKNWISPRFPAGASSDLSSYVLISEGSSPTDDDPVSESTSMRIRLDGVVE